MEKFWIVWSPQGARPPSFRHATFEAAYGESKRLALQAPGSEFFVLEALGVAKKVQVEFHAFDGCPEIDGIPF
jgi:hypothetical protein